MDIHQYEDAIRKLSLELMAYLLKIGAPITDAQDIVQDVFVKIIETEAIIPLEKIRAWMYRSAFTRYIDLYRRQARYQKILSEEFCQMKNGQFPDYSNDSLYQALLKLDSTHSTLLILYYEQELSIKEIATRLDYSESKIKTELHRGRKKLKKLLESEE